MADISLPQEQDYYRIQVRRKDRTLYYNRLDESEALSVVHHAESNLDGEQIVKVEHIVTTVEVTDVTEQMKAS